MYTKWNNRVILLILAQLLSQGANAQSSLNRIMLSENNIESTDLCETCIHPQSLKEPRSLVTRSDIASSITGNQQEDKQNLLTSLQSMKPQNMSQLNFLINMYVDRYYSNPDGSFSPDVSKVVNQLLDFIYSGAFDPNLSNSSTRIVNYLSQLESIRNNQSNPPSKISLTLTGNQQTDQENVLYAIQSADEGNRAQVAEFITRFLNQYFVNRDGTVDPALYQTLTKATSLIQDPYLNIRDPSIVMDYKNLFDELNRLSASGPRKTPSYIAPVLTGNKDIDAQNLLDSLALVSNPNLPEFIGITEKFIQRYYASPDGSYDSKISPTVEKIKSILANTLSNPQAKPNPKQLEELLKQLNSDHRNPNLPAYIQPILTGDRHTDLRSLINSIQSASKENDRQVAESAIDFMNKYYKNQYGTFDQSLQETVDEITEFVNSSIFNPSDHVSQNLISKWFNNLEMNFIRVQDPKAFAGYYQAPTITGNKAEDRDKLIDSMSTINVFNKADATNSFMNYLGKYYANKDGRYNHKSYSIINSILSLIQSSNFDASDPKNKEKMLGFFLQLDSAEMEAEKQPIESRPYKEPKLVGDKSYNENLIIQSVDSVNKENQYEFVAFVINYLNKNYVSKDKSFDPISFNIINQMIDFIRSPNFNSKDQITKDQIQNFFDQLNRIDQKRNNPNGNKNGFPVLKWKYDKDMDLQMLLDALRLVKRNNVSEAVDAILHYITIYYAYPDGSLDDQLRGYISTIINIVKNPDFKGADVYSIQKIEYSFGELDYMFQKIDYDAKYNKFVPPNLSGNQSQDLKAMLGSLKTMRDQDKSMVIDVVFQYILQYYGYSGGKLDDGMYPIVNQIISLIQSSHFNPSDTGKLEQLMRELDRMKAQIQQMNSFSTPYVAPKITGDKSVDMKNFFDSLGDVNNYNRMEAYNAFSQYLINYYGNSDNSFPYAFQPLVEQLLNMIKSTNINPNDAQTRTKIHNLLLQLDNAKKSARENQTPVAYHPPSIIGVKSLDLQNLLDSLKDANDANMPIVKQTIIEFMTKYFSGSDGSIHNSVFPLVNEFISYVHSADFEPSDYQTHLKQILTRLDSAFKESQQTRPAEEGYPSPNLTGNKNHDKQQFLDSLKMVTPSTKTQMLTYLDQLLLQYYAKPDTSYDPPIAAFVKQFKDILDSNSFDGKNSGTVTKLKLIFSQMDMALQKSKNPNASGSFVAPKLTGDKAKDQAAVLESIKSITKTNQSEAADFFFKFCTQYYGNPGGGFDFNVYPIVYKIISHIESQGFKPNDPGSKNDLMKLFKELDSALSSNKNIRPPTPIYIPPYMSGDKQIDRDSFLYSLYDLNEFTKPGAIDFAIRLLNQNYANPDGSFDYQLITLKSEFIKYLQNSKFEKLDTNGEQELRNIFGEMDKAKAKITGGIEADPFKSFNITGDKSKDFHHYLGLVRSINQGNRDSAYQYLMKLMTRYYGNDDGTMNFKMFPLVNNVMNYLKSPEFDPTNPNTLTHIQSKLTELDTQSTKIREENNLSPPYKQPIITGNKETDKKNLMESLSSVNRGNRQDAIEFITKLLNSNYGNPKGGYDIKFYPTVSKIISLVKPSSYDLNDPKNQKELDVLMTELEMIFEKTQSSQVIQAYKPPNCTGDRATDQFNLIQSFQTITSQNRQNAIENIEKFLEREYGRENGGYDINMFPIVSQFINLITTPNFDFQRQDNIKQLEYLFKQLDTVYQASHQNQHIKPYVSPALTDNKVADQQNLFQSFTNVVQTPQNKKKMTDSVMELIQKYYGEPKGGFDFKLFPLVHKAIDMMENDSFDFTKGENLMNLRFILNQLDTEKEKPKVSATGKQYQPPKLTGNKDQDLESTIESLKSVNEGNRGAAIEFFTNTLQKYYGNPDGSLDFSMYKSMNKIISLFSSPGFDFQNPSNISQIKLLLQEMDKISEELKKPQISTDPFSPPHFTGNREVDLENLLNSLKHQDQRNKPYVNEFIKDFMKFYFANPDGSYHLNIYPLITKVTNLITSKNFNFENDKSDLQKLLNQLSVETEKLKTRPDPPTPYVPPKITGNKPTDLKNLFDSLKTVNKYNKKDAIDYITKYTKLYYADPEGTFASSIHSLYTEMMSLITPAEFDLANEENFSSIRYILSKMDSAKQGLQNTKPISNLYKAFELTGQKTMDQQNLIVSFFSINKKNKDEAVNFIIKFLTFYYAEKDGTFDAPVYKLVNEIVALISPSNFDFSNKDNVEKIQLILIDLDKAHQETKAPKPVCNQYRAPEMSNEKKVDQFGLLKSLSSVTPCNRDQAINFIALFLNNYYTEKDSTFHSQVYPLVDKLIKLITPVQFEFANQGNLEQIQKYFNQLDSVYDKIQHDKGTPYAAPNFTGNIHYDQQALIASFQTVNDYNKLDAIKCLSDFVSKYYTDSDGNFEKPLYDLYNQLSRMVTSPQFDFASSESRNQVRDLLFKMDETLRKIQGPSNGTSSKYATPIISGNKAADQIAFLESFRSVTEDNISDATTFLVNLLNFYYRDSDNILGGTLYELSNHMINLVSSPNFNPRSLEDIDSIRRIFTELDEMQDRQKKNPKGVTYPNPAIIGDYSTDIQNIFSSFKFVNQENKSQVVSFIIDFMTKSFARSNGKFPPPLDQLANQAVNIMSSNTFRFTNRDDLNLLKSLLDEMYKESQKLNSIKGTGSIYNMPILTGNKSQDLQNLLDSLKSINSHNKASAIEFIIHFISSYYANPDGTFDPQIRDMVNTFINTINSQRFNFNNQECTQLTSMLSEIDVTWTNLKRPKPQFQPFLAPKWTGNKVVDRQSLQQALKSMNRSNKLEGIESIMKFVNQYYGNGDNSFEDIYYSTIDKLSRTLTSPKFDPSSPSSHSTIMGYLDQLDELKKQYDQEMKANRPYIPPVLTGSKSLDQQNLLNSLSTVTKANQPAAINSVLQFITKYFTDKDGQFDYAILESGNKLVSTLTSPTFDLTLTENVQHLKQSLDYLDKTLAQLKNPTYSQFIAPTLSGDLDSDISSVINAIKLVNSGNKKEVTTFVISFMTRYFSYSDGSFDNLLYPCMIRLLDLINSDNFNAKDHANEVKIASSLFDVKDIYEKHVKPKKQRNGL